LSYLALADSRIGHSPQASPVVEAHDFVKLPEADEVLHGV